MLIMEEQRVTIARGEVLRPVIANSLSIFERVLACVQGFISRSRTG